MTGEPTPADLPPDVRAVADDYLEAGGTTGLTVRLNEQAWQRWMLRPRMLRDVSRLDSRVEIFGLRCDVPLVLAPWSGQHLFDADAEVATARAARRAGVGYCLSSGSSRSVEDVGDAAGAFLFQLYLPEQRADILPVVERAKAAGACGLMITVDQPPQANRSGFRGRIRGLPPVHSPHFPGGNPVPNTPADLTPADIGWLAERSGLPVLVKGIVRDDDADAAVRAGAAGIVVSNHGGRQLDGGIPTALALPDVVAAVQGRVPVLVDGGIRSGEDVVRALALGAQGVLIGRPVARALRDGGAQAVVELLGALTHEIRAQLANCGLSSPSQAAPDLVRWRDWD